LIKRVLPAACSARWSHSRGQATSAGVVFENPPRDLLLFLDGYYLNYQFCITGNSGFVAVLLLDGSPAGVEYFWFM
jgi:hypothetical protein